MIRLPQNYTCSIVYVCSRCENGYDNEERARECCPKTVDLMFVCPECDGQGEIDDFQEHVIKQHYNVDLEAAESEYLTLLREGKASNFGEFLQTWAAAEPNTTAVNGR